MSRRIDRAPNLPMSATQWMLLLLAGLAACEVPNFAGPQLQDPPRGYLLQPNPDAPRSMFAYLPAVYHDAWVQSLPPYSTIHINGIAGTLSLEDVLAAQDSLRARPHDPDISFGAVEPLSIDGRDAWGWEERIDTPTRGIPWVAYRSMVPYDTISYSIEVSTEDPLLKAQAPDTLRAIVSTFAVGEVAYDWPLILVGAGLLLFAVHLARQKSRAKAARLQSINLVKIEKKKEGEPEGGAAPLTASGVGTEPAQPPSAE